MQEQTLAGGTAGLRTWVHLTQRSPGRGMGTYQPGPDKRKEVGTQGLVSRFGTMRNLSGNGKIPQERQVSQRAMPLTHWARNQNVLAIPV